MKVVLNQAGVDQAIRQAGVVRFLTSVADVVIDRVEANAPVQTGTFKGSITKTAPRPKPRGLGITVFSTDWAAHLVEMGSANNPAYAPFRKAASSLGLRLKGGGRP